MSTKVLKELAVAVSTYEDRNSGQTKNRYKNIGVLMESENNGEVNRYLLIDRTFNPAGVPTKPGSDKIIVSLFDPKPREGEQGNNRSSDDGRRVDHNEIGSQRDSYREDIPF